PLVQRQEEPPAPEEEPDLQAKPLVQRQEEPPAPEEEPDLQAKPLVQRQEEPPAPEEEPDLQAKPLVQRQEEPPAPEDDLGIQPKRSPQDSSTSSHNTSDDLENQLTNSKGGGSPLPDEVRSFMEPRFGADFSQVRVHTDSQAIQMNQAVRAQAFTHGNDIYFGEGKSPAISDLTAHELTHVVQQTGGIKLQRQVAPPQAAPPQTAPPQPDPNQTVNPIDPAKITATVGELRKNIVDGPSELEQLKKPLAGKSAEELDAIKKEYQAKYGKDFDSALKDATLDPAKIKAATDALFKAIDGWGSDEDTILKTLAGKSKAEVAAIRKEYSDHYGRNLDSDINSELSGSDKQEALAHLSGDKAKAAVEALFNSAGTFNDDEQKIESTLMALAPEDRKKIQEMAAQNPSVKAKIDKVLGNLGGEDLEVTNALLEDKQGEAAAIRINEALDGLGTDEEAVYKYLEGKDPKEIEAIRTAYKNKTGRELATDIVDDFSSAEMDIALGLERGDKAAAAAGRIKNAGIDKLLGTDEKGIYDQLKGKSPEERKAIIDAYESAYGKGSFQEMLKDELSDDDLEQAKQFAKDGQLDPVFALELATTKSLGTDEELLKETLKDKTADEIKKIREDYAKKTNGGNLDVDLAGEIDGRDAFEVGQLLKGKPQTAKEHYDRAMERYEFERGEGSTAFSQTMMDLSESMGMHSKGEQLEKQTQRLREMFDENGELKPDFTQEDVEKLAGYQETDATNYKDAKEAVGNAVSTVGTIAVAALVTICTKGAAAPWLVAVISGVAAGGANMALKYGMQGAAYGGEDIAIEALTAAISVALGGALADKTKFLAKLEDIVKGLGEDMAKKVALEALKGTVKGAAMGALKETMNDQNWRQGLAEYLEGIAKGATVGGVVGGVTSAATATVKGGLDQKTSSAMIEAGAGVVGAAIGEGVGAIKGEYKGRLEDLLGRLLVAGVSAAAEDKATSAASEARLSAIAKMVVAIGDDMPKVQQFLEAQVKYLEPEDRAKLNEIILTEVRRNEPDMSQSQTPNQADSQL
ncbi:DUF4157 domain-containing protein, partial [Microcoleus sp. FACHB-53]|nr:DUF4157 domain-containing protein [Microcoleus sp. FACHB-53]